MKNIKKKPDKISHPYEDIHERYLKDPKKAEEKPIYEILKLDSKDYPSPQFLGQREVKQKFSKLKTILEKHHILLEFSEKLPDQEVYRYLVEVFLQDKETVFPKGITHLTGCRGDCTSCFQMDYCDLKKEMWTDEAFKMEITRRKMFVDPS